MLPQPFEPATGCSASSTRAAGNTSSRRVERETSTQMHWSLGEHGPVLDILALNFTLPPST